MKKTILEKNLAGVSKSILALGGIKKQLDEPIKGIGNFIQAVRDLSNEDPQNQELKELLQQLNSIVAYVGGAGSDLFNLQAKLRKNREITAKIDSELQAEVKVRRLVREFILEEIRRKK